MPTYDPIKRIILKLNQQIEDLTVAKRVLENMTGSLYQKRSAAALMSNMDLAFEAHQEMNGNGHKPSKLKQAPKAKSLNTRGKPRVRAKGKMKPLPEVTIPAGLNVSGMDIRGAIVAALKAHKKPADTKTLTALLLGAGFTSKGTQPLTTQVGSTCGRHMADTLKGNKNGWALRG